MFRSRVCVELVPRFILSCKRRYQSSCLAGIDIRLLSKEDYSATERIYKTQFFGRQPLASHLRIDPAIWLGYLRPMIEDSLESKTSYGFYDKKSGEMIGLTLNRLGTEDHPEPKLERELPLNIRQLEQMYSAVEPIGLAAELGTRAYLEILVLCSSEGHDNKGLGLAMLKKNMERARELNCEYVVGTSVSVFARRMSERLGCKVIREIMYKDYIDPITGEKILEGIADPHHGAVLTAIKL